MKKRFLSLVLCLCVFMAAVAGCSDKKEEKKKEEEDSKTETIAAEDDNVENLHKVLMKNIGDYALKYATISDYKNMPIEIAPLQEITDEVFNQKIDELLEAYPFIFTGTVAQGDTANIDYEGSVDGELFKGGSAQGQNLTIGSGEFIQGFEEQLIGMSVGETKTIEVTFPEKYPRNPDLAGKLAQFKVTVNCLVSASGKATFNEQWVAAYLKVSGGVVTDASMEGFKKYFRTYLEKNATTTREENIKYAILDKLLETIEVKDVPEEQTSYYHNMIVNNIERNISGQNMTVEEYIEQYGMTKEEYDEQIEIIADERLKYEYAVLCIGEAENWLPTEEEYTALLQEYADSNAITVEEFRKQFQSQYQWDLYFEAYANKVLEKLKESVVITDKIDNTSSEDASGAAAE